MSSVLFKSIAGALPVLTGSAFAQTSNLVDNSTVQHRLETISVTAAKQAEIHTNIPASVSILDLADLSVTSTLTSADDITRLVPGVQAAIANGTQVAFQIRGIGAVDHQALTPGAAAVYSDGVLLATNVQTGGLLYDIETVEVLKGPQSTLYGRDTSSGTINFLSVRPSADQTRYIEASFGNFEHVDLNGAYGVKLADSVWTRVSGRYLSKGSTLKNVQTNPDIPVGPANAGGKRDEFGLRLGIVKKMKSGGEAYLRAHYEEDNGINPTPRNSNLDWGDFEISSEGDGVQPTDNEFYGVSFEWSQALGRWDLISLSAFEGYNQQYGFDFDGTPAPFGDPTLNANLSYDRDFTQLSEELRAHRTLEWGSSLIGIAGSYDEFSQRYTIWCGALDRVTLLGTCRYVGAPGRAGPVPASDGVATSLVTDIEQTRKSFAFFTRNEIDLSDRLSVIVGGRLSYDAIEGAGQGIHIFDDSARAFNNRDGLGAAIGENHIDESRLTGNLALRYALGGHGTAYVSIANGYKSGGFNGEVQNNALHFAENGLFDAETVIAYEAGFKAKPSDWITWYVAGFYQDYNAPQARIFVSFPLPDGSQIVSNSLSNLDEAFSFGLEGDFRISPAQDWLIEGGIVLLETEIDQVSNLGGNAALFDGNPLPFASKISATLGVQHTQTIREGLEITFGTRAKYRSEFFLDAEGLEERRQKGYTTASVDIGLTFLDRGLTLAAYGKNLLDEDFAVSGFGFIGYNTFRSTPREWGVRLRADF